MQFPVLYSTLSADALLAMAVEKYGIPLRSEITFLKRGFNDTYRIDTDRKKFILRVYKHGWRSKESIGSEIALLDYLQNEGVAVAYPIYDLQKEFIQTINAPEGERYAVLFAFAEGEQVRKLSRKQAHELGVATGAMHLLTEGKDFIPTAQNYSIEYQFDTALRVLKPILKDHPEEYKYLLKLQDDFLETFREVDRTQLSQGICHGDLQAENIHISGDRYTFFDFDFFGTGYLVYDIGIFMWYDHKNKPKEIIDAFLEGYQSEKKLTETELKLLPYFSTLRALFQMRLYCEISDGKQLPLWPAQQVAEFVEKLKKWHAPFGR